MSTTIEQLKTMAHSLSFLVMALDEVPCTESELHTLDTIAATIQDASLAIQKKTGSFRPPRNDRVWKSCEEQRSKAQSTVATLLAEGKLQNTSIFKRNIATIYRGPSASELDSRDVKRRKGITQRRCHRLQQLCPDSIVSWAVSYPPSSWGGGNIADDIFDCLVEDIQPNDIKAWPVAVRELLVKIRDAEIQDCPGLDQLVESEYLANGCQGRWVKLEQLSMIHAGIQPITAATKCREELQQLLLGPQPMSIEVRYSAVEGAYMDADWMSTEMKQMFSSAPAARVIQLPQPFREAVQNSRLWKWERSQGRGTTETMATLFPKDATQDVSFTIWCDHNDGYRLDDIYGFKLAFSS